MRDLWLIMRHTGGDYEYTEWPIEWRWSEAEAVARCEALEAQIKKLADSVPPCPEMSDPEAVWDRYISKEARARKRAEALGGALDATFFHMRLPAKSGPAESNASIPSEASAGNPEVEHARKSASQETLRPGLRKSRGV